MYKQVSYSKVIDKDIDCIVTGEGISLLDSSNINAQLIIDKVLLPFNDVNDIVKTLLDEIQYIEFWSNVNIYKY